MHDLDWTLPYPSQRQPVMGTAAVATSQPLAAQAGLEMLRRGGTAADAAIATDAAMTVLEPTTNGIGGDNFALVWDGTAVHGLNASGRAPAALTPDRFRGQPKMPPKMPNEGWDPVTVPGAVSGWMALSKRFGKLPFATLFEPAIRYAEEGFLIAPLTAELWKRGPKRYGKQAEWMRVFTIDGRTPAPGERMRFPDHAATLRAIGATNGEDFYRGAIAERIARAALTDGGLLSAADLAAQRAEWVEPLSLAHQGARMHQIPPNGQGIVALIALAILGTKDTANLEVDCPDLHHLAIEATKLAFRVAHREVADPRYMTVKPSELLDPARIAALAAKIDPSKAQDFQHGPPNKGGTILLCAADAEGRMVSLIQSNYEGWGSGIVIPGTGIAMHNRGANFTLEEGHPNQVGGGKRPYHTIIPGFVTREPAGGAAASPLCAFGVMGGFMQPQGQLQTFLRMVDYGQNPQAALDAPRWQVTAGLEVQVEPGFEPSFYEELRRRGHELKVAEKRSVSFGRGQVIWRLDGSGGYAAASDLRADGQAVVV